MLVDHLAQPRRVQVLLAPLDLLAGPPSRVTACGLYTNSLCSRPWQNGCPLGGEVPMIYLPRPVLHFLVSIVGIAVAAAATPVQPLPEGELVSVLSNLTVLAEAEHPASPAIRVQVFRVIEHGECGGTPQSCPMSMLYCGLTFRSSRLVGS